MAPGSASITPSTCAAFSWAQSLCALLHILLHLRASIVCVCCAGGAATRLDARHHPGQPLKQRECVTLCAVVSCAVLCCVLVRRAWQWRMHGCSLGVRLLPAGPAGTQQTPIASARYRYWSSAHSVAGAISSSPSAVCAPACAAWHGPRHGMH